jgi:nucleoside-diphosphate-sugar epimerase
LQSTYLVTGGAGFIGSHIVEGLVAKGHSVRILDNFHSGRKENLRSVADQVTIIEGDVRDLRTARESAQGVDFILHLAALVSVTESVQEPDDTLAVNIDGTLNVLKAAKEAGVQRVVLSSSCAVYGEGRIPAKEDQPLMPLSPYAASKMAVEGLAISFHHSYGLPVVCLRYFNVYGPRQTSDSPYSGVIAIFASRLIDGKLVTIYGDGRQTRDFIYVGDVVRANQLACRKKTAVGRVINIGTGRGRSLRELHSTLASLCGSRNPPQYADARPGDIYHSRCDPSRARSLLGFQPRTDFRKGLEKTLAWQRGASEAGAHE